MNANTIRTLTIRSKVEGGQETSTALKGIRGDYERLVSATEKSAESQAAIAEAMAKVQRSFDMAARSQQEFVRVQQQMRAANDNASSSFRISGAEAASLANHLKNAALAAYALSPAFRGLVNPLIPAALHAIGPAAVTAGKMVLSALTPLLSFMARVALPIYAAAKAIQYLVNSVGEGVRDFQAFQAQQVALQNTLNATAGASGKSAAEINKLADGMGDIGKSREAAKALLEFQGVAGPTFDRALKAANDLAAAGMGNVVSAARAMGKALEEPGNGLDAFTAAGVRFTTQQRHLIKELVETGDRAGAVNTILGIVEGRVGGSAAAATNTLEGAYRQLNDALQRGSEQFGKTIVEATGLVRIVQTLADAVNALNNIDISGFVSRFKTIRGISAILGFFSSEKPNDASTGKGSSGADAQRKADAAAAQLQRDAIDKVTISIQKEIDALKQSELQKQIDTNLRLAGVAATSEAGRAIASSTTQLFSEKKAIEDANEARRKAEATAARQGEQLRKMDADRQNRLTQLQLERQSIGMSEEAALALRLREEELGKERRAGIAETPQRIASIDAWAKETAKLSIENERLRDALRQVKDIAGTAVASFIRDLSQGVDMMDALRSAARALGDTLIDIGTKKLVSMAVDQAASMFGAGSDPAQAGITGGVALATGGATAASEMIAGAMTAAEILGGGGLLAGAEEAAGGVAGGEAMAAGGIIAGTAINGPLVLLMAAIVAVGALLNMWSSGSAKAKQEEEAQARAWEAWQAAAVQLASYFSKSQGTSIGNIIPQLQEHQSEAERLIKLRSQSQGFTSAAQENADPIIRQIREAYALFAKRLKEEFHTNFAPTIEAMKSGFGEDSPIFQAFQNVKSVGEKLQAFIADAELVYGKGTGPVNEARAAAQQRALSLLQGEQDPLSAVAKRMQEIQGTARGLQKVLEDLGMSSEEARRQIEAGVVRAIETLKKAFTEDLQRELNDLQGNGQFNDALDIIKKNAERLKDNAALGGGNEDLIAKLFGLSAQGIVDRFKLTGEAFQELIKRFPELAGIVKEFTEAVVKRSKEDIARARESIEDELFNLTNDTSTVAGQLAALEREFNRRRLEEVAAGGELIPELEELYQKRRLKIIEDANTKALEEAKRAAEEQARAINQAARGVLETIQGWQAGPSSTLSPQDILTNAQAFYSSNLALAQGNPADQVTIDAVNKWPQLAENVEKALRAVYGSATQYQTGKSQLIAEGLALQTVQAADDPLLVMMRRVAEATEATVEELTSTIKAAIDAGNAASTAANLLPMFTSLNTTVLTLPQLQALGLFTSAGGQAIFNEIDTNDNQIIEKSEAIRAATQPIGNTPISVISNLDKVSFQVGTMANNVITLIGQVGGMNNNVITLQDFIGTTNNNVLDVKAAVAKVNDAIGTGGGTNSLQSLNATAKSQLELLNINLTNKTLTIALAVQKGTAGTNPTTVNETITVSNDLLLALNKIVYNTFTISNNTAQLVKNMQNGPAGWTANDDRGFWKLGTFSAGGWIGGNLHSHGGTHIEAELGEHVTNRISAGYNRSLLDTINMARGPLDLTSLSGMNDNFRITPNIVPLPTSAGRSDAGFNFARMLSVMEAQNKEIAELKKEVASFRKENGVNIMRGAQHVREGTDETTEAVDGQTSALSSQERQSLRQKRVAQRNTS